eukprot:TRINITY_DN315_c0_g1_i1.p1 TRINITY_DN315_c0_g1~~TRINITY_DN315_c0_g1_i1.p1  ORF type:complete len:447 (-),score=68.36 TRINITY_DN315_c0_g1_i1:25-1365(-)
MVKRIGKYELGKTLGSGTFGKVKHAIDTSDPLKTAYAIKVLDRKQIEKENMQEQLKNEIAIMKLLKHDHVVKMFEVIQSPQHIYIVLELVTGGELFDRIVAAKRFDENTARRYFQQLIFGVHYCHSQGVAHRDLKPENLLVDASDSLKISDFGLSALNKDNGKLLMTTCGTPNYVAPEVLKEKGYNGVMSDVWSCGVILFVMLAGFLPFDDPTMNGLFAIIERGEYRIPKHFTPPVKSLINRMLTVDPTKRITLSQVMADQWFVINVDQDQLRIHSALQPAKAHVPSKEALDAAIVETTDHLEKHEGTPTEARQLLTAFELASQLVMGSLSPLVSRADKMQIRRGTQLIANGDIAAVTKRVLQALQAMKANPQQGKQGGIKGVVNTAKGIMQYHADLYPTVCKELTFLQISRLRGDTLEFQRFYRQLVRLLHEICPQQPPKEEDAE